MPIPPQQLDFPSAAFHKDRTFLTVGEVADKWEVSEQHVIDLIEEGKLAAFDMAGQQSYVRTPMSAIVWIADRLGMQTETLLDLIRSKRPVAARGRSRYRIPVVEGFIAFMKENHAGK